MSAGILIKGGRVVDPATGRDGNFDVRIRHGRIHAVESALQPEEGEQVIDAKGCWVTAGWIDLHAHLREPGQEHKETIETGSQSAVAGGFTTVLAMANTKPVNDSPAVTKMMIDRAREVGLCRVLPVGAATKNLDGETLAEIGLMVEAGAVMISDDGKPVMSAAVQRKVFEYCKALNVPVAIHAEDLELTGHGAVHEGKYSVEAGLPGIPAASEDVMVVRDVVLARMTGAHLHVAHISTRGAVEAVRRAKAEGLKVTAEVTPHHLALTDKEVLRYDTDFKMAPPLRSEDDRNAVIDALADGTIDCVATDHAPHARSEKEVEFERAPNGVVGFESALPIVLQLVRERRVPLMRAIDSVTRRAAEILNRNDIGRIAPGALADVAVIDPEETWTFDRAQLRSKSKNTPFHGMQMQGRVRATIFEGKLVYTR
jgi:dihydroorotase